MQAMPALGSVGAPHDCPLVDRTDDAQAEIFVDEQFAGELLHVLRSHRIDPLLDLLRGHLAAARRTRCGRGESFGSTSTRARA